MTDTSDAALQALIVRRLIGRRAGLCIPAGAMGEDRPADGGAGYVEGHPGNCDRDHGVDLAQLLAYLRATQPGVVERFERGRDRPARLNL